MSLYRAVPKKGFDPQKIYEAQTTRRVPSNIPYLVDNIWEWLRPTNAPSRRHAVYASPTLALALANASAVGHNPDDYVACVMKLSDKPEYKLAHLNVTDARHHNDVRTLTQHVMKRLGQRFVDMDVAQKITHAPLFLPAVSRTEMQAYFASSDQAGELAEELRQLSTFWRDVELSAQNHNGELFIELPPGGRYLLHAIT